MLWKSRDRISQMDEAKSPAIRGGCTNREPIVGRPIEVVNCRKLQVASADSLHYAAAARYDEVLRDPTQTMRKQIVMSASCGLNFNSGVTTRHAIMALHQFDDLLGEWLCFDFFSARRLAESLLDIEARLTMLPRNRVVGRGERSEPRDSHRRSVATGVARRVQSELRRMPAISR